MKKEDLHKIIPKLREISLKRNGFKIPENYFKTVEDGVMAKLKAEKFTDEIKNNTFKTPENYFETVEDIILTKLKAEAIYGKSNDSLPENYFNSIEETVLTKIKSESKIISLKSKWTRFLVPIAIAASLLLVFILDNNSSKITFDSLATTEIEDWVYSGDIDFDVLSIMSMYPEIELDDDIFTASLSDDEVLEYLYEEDLDEIIYKN